MKMKKKWKKKNRKKIVTIPPLLYYQRNKTETKKIKVKGVCTIVTRSEYIRMSCFIFRALSKKQYFICDVCNSMCVHMDLDF